MINFLYWIQYPSYNSGNGLPKAEKNRFQQFSECQFPEKYSNRKTCGIAESQVTTADFKTKL